MRALFIQQDHVSPTGPIGEAFEARGYDIELMQVVPAEHHHSPSVSVAFPDPTQFDVIVPMGAPWSVYDEALIGTWVTAELGMLRQAVDAGMPVFGICFGGQALAAALGGQVLPADRMELGWTTVRTDRPDLIAPGPWFQWHLDRWQRPPVATALAWTDVSEQAFVVGNSLGVQFHPEMTPGMLDGWLANGGDTMARASGYDPDELRRVTGELADEAARRSRALVDAFLDHVAGVPIVG